jgi:hypothetical protein
MPGDLMNRPRALGLPGRRESVTRTSPKMAWVGWISSSTAVVLQSSPDTP